MKVHLKKLEFLGYAVVKRGRGNKAKKRSVSPAIYIFMHSSV